MLVVSKGCFRAWGWSFWKCGPRMRVTPQCVLVMCRKSSVQCLAPGKSSATGMSQHNYCPCCYSWHSIDGFYSQLTLLPLLNSSMMNYLLFLYCIIYIFIFCIGWCFGILETFWLGSYWRSLGRKGLILKHVFDIRTNQSRARPILSRLCFPGSKILLP